MTGLIEFWLARLDERGVPLVELEGDRVRYGRFGWENAGREWRYRITGRSFDDPASGSAGARPFHDDDVDTIREIHGTERYRVHRDRRRYERLLGQTGLETLLHDGDEPAYLCYRGTDPANVLEFGGSPSGVTAILGTLLGKTNDVVVSTHPHHPLNPLFRDLAASWEHGPHRKLNLLDLAATIDAYEPFLEERWSRFAGDVGCVRGDVTLGVVDSDERTRDCGEGSVTITYDSEGIDVVRSGREPDVTLDRRGMVDLLFGSPDVLRSVDRPRPFLDAVLPLEYYFWQTETI